MIDDFLKYFCFDFMKLYFARINDYKSQAEVAKYIGVSRNSYSSWEAGKSVPSIYHALLLCKFFNLEFHDIFYIKVEV